MGYAQSAITKFYALADRLRLIVLIDFSIRAVDHSWVVVGRMSRQLVIASLVGAERMPWYVVQRL